MDRAVSISRSKPLLRSLALIGMMLFWASSAQSQQILVNGDFEAVQQPNPGNNTPPTITPVISPWVLGAGSEANVVRVNGPNGFNYLTGPKVDASGQTGWRHYLDIKQGSNTIYQSFTPQCAGQVTFSGFFSSRISGGAAQSGTGSIAIHQGIGAGGTKVAETPVAELTTATWQQSSATATVAAGQTYSFVVNLDNDLNFDEGTVTYVDNCNPEIVTEGPGSGDLNVIPPPDPCCPPWSEQVLEQSLVYFSTGSIGSPYTLRWQPSASLNAQMQAYLNYLNAVNPAITNISIVFGLYPAGTGAAPGNAGPQVGGTAGERFVIWTAGGNAPYVSPNFFPNGSMNTGQWYTVGTGIYLNDGAIFFPETCAENAISVRVQVTPGVRPQSGGPTARSANAPLEVRMAPRPISPAAAARRARPRAR